ncbi:hypothetical protein [Nostoc sp.]|uniref:hypothetical protein n=1 Tax=Nostoc sp. TaxID=1180 RepID=UPI002FF9C57E
MTKPLQRRVCRVGSEFSPVMIAATTENDTSPSIFDGVFYTHSATPYTRIVDGTTITPRLVFA